MFLSEILDVTLDYTVNLNDTNSMSKLYDIAGEKLPGNECVSKFITETLEQSFTDFESLPNKKGEAIHKLELKDAKPSSEETPLDIGPNRYLTMTFKTKIRHGLALKYKIITKETRLSEKETWKSYLKPNIFFSIINNEKVYSKLNSVNLGEFLGQRLRKNSDQSFSRYEYRFYDTEKPDWANQERLKDVVFKDGFLEIIIDLPVYEEKVPAKSKAEDELEKRSF